jgi:hypothetical protein
MAQSVVYRQADIGLINTDKLQINSTAKTTMWQNIKRHPDTELLNGAVTVRLPFTKNGSKGILGNQLLTVGSSLEKYKFKVHAGTVIHVGIAEITRNLDSVTPGPDLASKMLTVTQDDTVFMELTSTTLQITHKGIITGFPLSDYTGKTMYPWISGDVTGNGYSVSIFKDGLACLYVDHFTGSVVLQTFSNNGSDRPLKIDTGSSAIELTGPLLSLGDLVLGTGVVTSTNIKIPISLLNVTRSDGLYVDSDTGQVSFSNGLTLTPGPLPAYQIYENGTLWYNSSDNNMYVRTPGGWQVLVQPPSP